MKINFYSKNHCPLCDKGLEIVKKIQNDIPFTLEVLDIYEDDVLLEKYQIVIPVVEIEGVEVDYGILSEEKIRAYIKEFHHSSTRK